MYKTIIFSTFLLLLTVSSRTMAADVFINVDVNDRIWNDVG